MHPHLVASLWHRPSAVVAAASDIVDRGKRFVESGGGTYAQVAHRSERFISLVVVVSFLFFLPLERLARRIRVERGVIVPPSSASRSSCMTV